MHISILNIVNTRNGPLHVSVNHVAIFRDVSTEFSYIKSTIWSYKIVINQSIGYLFS
jgi:hypothetical protein